VLASECPQSAHMAFSSSPVFPRTVNVLCDTCYQLTPSSQILHGHDALWVFDFLTHDYKGSGSLEYGPDASTHHTLLCTWSNHISARRTTQRLAPGKRYIRCHLRYDQLHWLCYLNSRCQLRCALFCHFPCCSRLVCCCRAAFGL
jgi:hypothetical protein